LNIEDQYGLKEGKPANFLVLDADSPFEAVRQRAEVLASIRHGEYLFKRPEPRYEVELDLFRKTQKSHTMSTVSRHAEATQISG
jgi:cytosine deaminase